MLTFFTIILICLAGTNAHIAAFDPAMYCIGEGDKNMNANKMCNPLYQLEFSEWWFHHTDKCDEFPPPAHTYLELPAGGSFTVQLAANQAFTDLSYGGSKVTKWPDGGNFTDLGSVDLCTTEPNLHAENKSMAAGTAFAIAYVSEISEVTQKNLVVFSVLYYSPWELAATYEVPAAMPPCPAAGCICAWTWIPNGCGTPNMYMGGHRCNVTHSTSKVPLATAKPAVWCEGDPKNCTKGAKQVIGWNQLSGNNIVVSGSDLSGRPKSPGYNMKCGFKNGAQNDIFATSTKRESVHEDENENEAGSADNSSHKRNSLLSRHAEKHRIRNW